MYLFSPFKIQLQDIWKQVNQFLQGAAPASRSSSQISFENLSSSALLLLQTVPVARHAVLEHYANVFDEAVNTHLCSVDSGDQSMYCVISILRLGLAGFHFCF